MKKFQNLAALTSLILASVFFFSELSQFAHARITGDPPSAADSWCTGPSGKEVCVNEGNLVPTTNNNSSLGSSSLKWSDVQAASGSFDNLTFPDGAVTTAKLGDGSVTTSK